MSTKSALTLAQLQCFVCVVDVGSFVEAGRRLGMTTSGVSKTLARLEAACGVRLLNRSTHALSLTPEGERLICVARDALQAVSEVDLTLRSAASYTGGGRVRVSVPTAILRSCLVPLLQAFRTEHPDILLDLRGSDQMMDLADGAFDLVLRTGGLETVPGHRRQLLARFSWLVCGSPDYLGRRGAPKTPLDLRAHDVIAFRNQQTGLVDAWRFTDRENGITRWQPDPALVLDDANAIAAAAVAGVGLVWTPSWLVREAISSGSLVPVLSDWSCEPMDISIVRRPQEQNPERIRKVIAFLIAHAQVFA